MTETVNRENFVELFPGDVKHLFGNLFRVRREAINFSSSGLRVENGKLIFGNPRWIQNGEGIMMAKGLGQEEMTELRKSIQSEGLENPLRLRVSDDNTLELIGGERRLRSITMLVSENQSCYDPSIEEMVPASELYEWIDCRINRMDDKTATRFALKPNETGEDMGEMAAIYNVKMLRAAGCTDQEIMETTGKSVTWIRESDDLLKLDATTMRAFEQREINRKVALALCKIKDAQDRLERLERLRQSALERIAKRQKMLDEDIESRSNKIEILESDRGISDHVGDKKLVDEATKKIAEEEEKISENEAEKEELSKTPPTATVKDLDNVVEEDERRPWSASKIDRFWLTPLKVDIRRHGKAEDGSELGIDMTDASLTVAILTAIVEGKKDPHNQKQPFPVQKILAHHNKKKSE